MKSTAKKLKSQIPGNWPKEKYSKRFAWNYILRLAAHRVKYPYYPRKNYKWYVKKEDKAKPILLDRGQVGIKKSHLAIRWKWSRSKVDRFLDQLIAEERIKVKGQPGNCTIITVLDLDKEFKNKPK